MNSRFARALRLGVWCLWLASCGGLQDKPNEFVYLALGASDAAGVGAVPVTEGYVYLIARELDRRGPEVILINLGAPGARIDLVDEQVRFAKQLGTKADVANLWTGANDVVQGDQPKRFRERLVTLLGMLKAEVARVIVVANLPDLTQLPRFRATPHPSVTPARIDAFNAVIAEATRAAGGTLIDLHATAVRDDLVFHEDGFHPNNEGHREIARQVLQALLPDLSR
jgi:lysophospholipase L1-like esterase